MRLQLTLLVVALALVGCRTAEDTVVGSPPVTATQAKPQVERPPAPRARVPAPRLSISGWPFQENTNTFELHWVGGDAALPLYAAPDLNSELIGEVSWDDGERILWRDTAVSTFAPRVLRADGDDWVFQGPIYREGHLTEEQYTEARLNRGGRIEVWAYGGDGVCYLAAPGGEIFTSPCPSPEHFKGVGAGEFTGSLYLPDRQTWWIQITGANISAWVAVDGKRMRLTVVER